MSDAMWRVYSPDHLGVRLKTTRTKLRSAMKAYARTKPGYQFRVADVKYTTTKSVVLRTERIVNTLNEGWDPKAAADLLFLKRRAFVHEDEVRALIFCPEKSNEVPKRIDSGLQIPVDSHSLIESILFDPRAPDALVDALRNFVRDVLGYKGHMAKSQLYTNPNEYLVTGDEEL